MELMKTVLINVHRDENIVSKAVFMLVLPKHWDMINMVSQWGQPSLSMIKVG